MNDATEQKLMHAYELIEAGNLEQAKTLLMPILAGDKNNADAWWIYSHAVTDPQSAKEALDNVLRIDRDYSGARELRDQLAVQLVDNITGTQVPVPIASAGRVATPPPVIEQTADDKDDDGGFNLLRILLIAAVFIIIAVVGILLAQSNQPPVDVVTVQATSDSSMQAAATDALPEQNSASSAVLVLLNTAITEADATPFGTGAVVEGDLAVANICGAQGAVIGRIVDALKLALGRVSTAFSSDIQRVGIRVFDCTESSEVVRVQIDTDVVSANAYANDGLTDTEFADRWTVFTDELPADESAGG